VHVAEKLHKVERYDHKLIRVDVELFHERNPRQSDHCQRIEITCYSRGPVIRAEACASDFYAALDAAIAKLDTRLRRAADRRRVHRGRHAPVSVAAATAGLLPDLPGANGNGNGNGNGGRGGDVRAGSARDGNAARTGATALADLDGEEDEQPWHIVRKKAHPAAPMTVDDALFQMELVGHDFYLFFDKDSGKPSVVYRRKGYDYGVISLSS
jgi:ribosomal subunit interface protein